MTGAVSFNPKSFIHIENPTDLYEKNWYKVYRDEGHYVGIAMFRSKIATEKKKSRYKRFIASEQEAYAADYYSSCLYEINGSKAYRRAVAKAKTVKKLMEQFPDNDKQQLELLTERIGEKKTKSYCARYQRFKRKALLNTWTHFVTITRDDALFSDEESFCKSVEKCFSNLHSRRGWKVMMRFERGDMNGRGHYHALISVPEGQMVGSLEKITNYSFKRKRTQTIIHNTFFTERFGLSDFEAINPDVMIEAVGYMTKYLDKDDSRIRYSRGIATEICLELANNNIPLEFDAKTCVKSVILDNAVDWSYYIENFRPIFEKRIKENLKILGKSQCLF